VGERERVRMACSMVGWANHDEHVHLARVDDLFRTTQHGLLVALHLRTVVGHTQFTACGFVELAQGRTVGARRGVGHGRSDAHALMHVHGESLEHSRQL
jgi:hypothetical protein